MQCFTILLLILQPITIYCCYVISVRGTCDDRPNMEWACQDRCCHENGVIPSPNSANQTKDCPYCLRRTCSPPIVQCTCKQGYVPAENGCA
uniref:TIL domain-containing protein n=1 Tax=Acrobeloides nanus TaxID=290746 RepID=A0A914CFZ7_9BILA